MPYSCRRARAPVGSTLAGYNHPLVPTTKRALDRLAGVEYAGLPGISAECKDAVIRLLQYGDVIQSAKILTHDNDHGLLLTINVGDIVAVKTGFASGYGGEGPSTFSFVLQVLEAHKVEIEEYDVAGGVLERLDQSALRCSDLDRLERQRPVRPRRWHDYIQERHSDRHDKFTLWREFPTVIPFAVVDPRIMDLALSFWDAPNDRIFEAYRRLEDVVRARTGLKEKSGRLFSAAFMGDGAMLRWPGCDAAEQAGRAELFRATFTAYRNPRAHGHVGGNAEDKLSEFLLVNSQLMCAAPDKGAIDCARSVRAPIDALAGELRR